MMIHAQNYFYATLYLQWKTAGIFDLVKGKDKQGPGHTGLRQKIFIQPVTDSLVNTKWLLSCNANVS